MRYAKIPILPGMEEDLGECEDAAKRGEEKTCSECTLDGGDYIGCLADYEWCGGRMGCDGKEKGADP